MPNKNSEKSCSHSYSQSRSRKFVMFAYGKGYITVLDFKKLNSFCSEDKLEGIRIESKSTKK